MRIDRYLVWALGKPLFARVWVEDIESRFNRTCNRRHSLYLDLIYTQHNANWLLFTKDKVFDESEFQRKRNLLGIVLLLKDMHNLSNNDEIYRYKCDAYSKSNSVWNELLVGHILSTNFSDLPVERRLPKVEPTESCEFTLEQIANRSKVVFAAIKAM